MTAPGSYRKISRNRSFEAYLDPGTRAARRVERILDSLRRQITDQDCSVRVRQVISEPQALYRLEIETEELAVQRTTLLSGDALDVLLEAEEVRARVRVPG